MREVITSFFRFCLRIFFRRIEVESLERVPRGPVIFAVNHPNGLLDPLFLLCFTGRPVSFLAKKPLFHLPIIGWIVRVFETIPVYRKQDQTTGSNEEMFSRARDLLRRGGSIAIFPEGTTHDDPQLRELKTGAARIALGASLERMSVVPTGIYYTAKHVFRSSVLVVFGDPLPVTRIALDDAGEPPVPIVDALTAEIDAGLDEVTVQADSNAALALIGRAEDIFTADDEAPLMEEFELRRQFLGGYHYLSRRDPRRLQKLENKIAQFEAELRRAKVDVHELKPKIGVLRLFRVLVLLPIAVIGTIVNTPTYLLVERLAHHLAKGESAVLATFKFLGALALYPLTYLLLALLGGLRFDVLAGILTAIALPFISLVTLRVVEDLDDMIGDLRALAHRLFRRYGHQRLVTQRNAIRAELLAIAREMRT